MPAYRIQAFFCFQLLILFIVVAVSPGAGAPPGRQILRELSSYLQQLPTASGTWKRSGTNASDTSLDGDREQDLLRLPRVLNLWQGERQAAADRGLEYHLESSGEYFHTLEDENEKRDRSYYHDLYLQLSIDLARIGFAPTGTVFVSAIAGWEKTIAAPSSSETSAGTVLPTNSTPGSGNSVQLYELWYERAVGRARWLVGLRDLTYDFYQSRFNDALANGGFWIGTDISANTPLAIYEVTLLGARCRYEFSNRIALLAGLFEGNPGGSERNPHGLGWHIGPEEGSFRIFELQLKNPLPTGRRSGNLKLGTWHHSGPFDDLRHFDEDENPLLLRRNWGNYVVFDQKLFDTDGDSERGLGFFCHGGGGCPTDRATVESYLGAGFSLTGTFRGRDKDVLSLGVNRTSYSTALREYNELIEESFLTREEVLEIAYQYRIRPGLTIRPDLQIIKNAGGDPEKPHSRFFSLRCTAIF